MLENWEAKAAMSKGKKTVQGTVKMMKRSVFLIPLRKTGEVRIFVKLERPTKVSVMIVDLNKESRKREMRG